MATCMDVCSQSFLHEGAKALLRIKLDTCSRTCTVEIFRPTILEFVTSKSLHE